MPQRNAGSYHSSRQSIPQTMQLFFNGFLSLTYCCSWKWWDQSYTAKKLTLSPTISMKGMNTHHGHAGSCTPRMEWLVQNWCRKASMALMGQRPTDYTSNNLHQLHLTCIFWCCAYLKCVQISFKHSNYQLRCYYTLQNTLIVMKYFETILTTKNLISAFPAKQFFFLIEH